MKPLLFLPIAMLAIVFVDQLASAGEVQVDRAVAYLPHDRPEKSDLYIPLDSGPPRPAIVIMHGGGWIGGERNAHREVNLGMSLGGHGYVCLSIDYWCPDPTKTMVCCWPQNIYDCKNAVRWLRANAKKYNIDADHIGAIGGSAGGHLAAMLAVTGPECGLDPLTPASEFSCQVQCAVDMYGPVDTENWIDIKGLMKTRADAPELYQAFSVLSYVSREDPPLLILQGTNDPVVAVSQSEALARVLKKHGVTHHLEIIENAPHSFDLQPEQRDLRPQVFEFFDHWLQNPQRVR